MTESTYKYWLHASHAAIGLGIKSKREYRRRYKEDPLLPKFPEEYYNDIWKSNNEWDGFLTHRSNRRADQIYQTWGQASKAAQRLGIKNSSDYKQRYWEDSCLPRNPDNHYASDWRKNGGIDGFLGKPVVSHYDTWEEAAESARKLKMVSAKDYVNRRDRDLRLPGKPEEKYRTEWGKRGGWQGFLDTGYLKNKYKTWDLASKAAIALNIKSAEQYYRQYKKDPKLPRSPQIAYPEIWRDANGWKDFLGTTSRRKIFFASYAEASQAARALGITSQKEYVEKYKLCRQLPAKPNRIYEDVWLQNGGMKGFLGVGYSGKFYEQWHVASAAAKALGFETPKDYIQKHALDPKLPATPRDKYKDVWVKNGGWRGFLGGGRVLNPYESWGDASVAAKKLKIKSWQQYATEHKKDIRLPAAPMNQYSDVWSEYNGWHGFLGIKTERDFWYKTLDEVRAAIRRLGIRNLSEYRAHYKDDKGLPANPNRIFSSFPGWPDVALPVRYRCLGDVKWAVKVLKIKNSVEYKKARRAYPSLPAHPELKFKEEWVDWFDMCDIPRFYEFDECRNIAIANGASTQNEYRRLCVKLKDPRMAKTPDQVYLEEWKNWYHFLGRKEPYVTKNIDASFDAWKKSFDEFLSCSRASKQKESYLCRFLRDYIAKYDLAGTPEEFVSRKDHELWSFQVFLDEQSSISVGNKILMTLNEYFEYVISMKMTFEDLESGEIRKINNARNPFNNYRNKSGVESTRRDESVKPSLAFQFVDELRRWIVPDGATNFQDLRHLQIFDADWVNVDEETIDFKDPNCVIKFEHGRYKIWCPVYWMHTYALCSVPARGKQLAYNDSGEADVDIPIVSGDKLSWTKNRGQLAGMLDKQGFIKKLNDDACGMYFTTNKTGYQGSGYSVPWIPERLAYWMIILREWQSKYNPIEEPTAWLSCRRTLLNESQLRAKGANCFLFRDYNDIEPGHFQGRLAARIAAGLYYSQPKDLKLASLVGQKEILAHYKTDYPPHSMRVSLITAYATEFGLPLDVIMKVVGHASIVMSLYYVKSSPETLKMRIDEGEKRALKNKASFAQAMMEQNRISELRGELIGSDGKDAYQTYASQPPGSFLFRDYGICPYAGSRCSDGGELLGKKRVRSQVVSGYLGRQNCVRCRHFITGPAFLGGLISLENEISLAANTQAEHYQGLVDALELVNIQIKEETEVFYDRAKRGDGLDDGALYSLDQRKRKITSELESAAEKLDLLMCDMQAVSSFVADCLDIINNTALDANSRNKSVSLVADKYSELSSSWEEVSHFHQLCEVCENAEIFESSSAKNAVIPRSQMLDRMADLNKLSPRLYNLSPDQQLILGNQVVRLLLSRLRTWESVDKVVKGEVRISDLSFDQSISDDEFKIIFSECRALVPGVDP
ncbi:VPA1269 family protein [Litorivivens sp.]|uniref:gamma-mobile-trio integrase GmtZ n=1 Tax=Litorivivens sp. TaxID=2020868 RepID=UPI0035657154